MAGTEKAGAAFKSVKVPLETWRRLRILAAQTDDSIAGVIGRMAAVFSAAKPKVLVFDAFAGEGGKQGE